MIIDTPGPLVLLGSGETSDTGRKTWDSVFARTRRPVRVSILETPAGFQPNAARVAGRIAEFIRHRLQNYKPDVITIPARHRAGPHFSPDNLAILEPMLTSNVLFAGPGSPTYAVRHLRASLAWQILLARHRMGSAVVLASAAVVAAGTFVLPVYEIYKVGEDLHWHEGLDILGPYNLPIAFVPHWNNTEGGDDLDTSRCFVGQQRLDALRRLLPVDVPILGIDEHTTLTIDLAAGEGHVHGIGTVTILQADRQETIPAGRAFPLDRLGTPQLSPASVEDVPPQVFTLIHEAQARRRESEIPPADTIRMVEQREDARGRKAWDVADRLRTEIAARGWRVSDTPEGPQLEHILDE